MNQRVSDPLLVLQLIFLLLQKPTNDSVEIAVNVTKECGQCLQEDIPQALNGGNVETEMRGRGVRDVPSDSA